MFSFQALPDDADAVLAMDPEELGLGLLATLARPPFSTRARLTLEDLLHTALGPSEGLPAGIVPSVYPAERHREIRDALAEAWAWLEGAGLIVPTLEHHQGAGESFHPRNRRLSRKAHQVAIDGRPVAGAGLLPKPALHSRIRDDVWAQFHRGKFDTAVFEAMKAVEVYVRETSGLPADCLGVKLMRTAFSPANGPLTDRRAESGERTARMELFAGAIGAYKNPYSHRCVVLDDPVEAAEIIMLACHLLRIVDAREVAKLV